MASYHYSPILFMLLALLTQLAESRLTQETFTAAFGATSKSSADEGTKWAVLVAGSKGFGNYRHQADICHAYQILKRGGLKDENIIVFMYDDIAYNEENPREGIIINNPEGGDVYNGVPKDYTGDSLTTLNLLAAILGNRDAIEGGSGKVVDSGPNDRIFIYYSDHGSPGVLTMPNHDDLYANDLINTLEKKHLMGTYKSMVIYVEACEAGSLFAGLLPEDWNIYVTTASNPSESSWSVYCPGIDPRTPSEFDTCLGDLYSVAWMEDIEIHNADSETLAQQYQVVKTRTAAGGDRGSHVMEYGDMNFNTDPLSLYLGSAANSADKLQNKGGKGSHKPIAAVEQHEADILYLRRKVLRAPEGSVKRKQYETELKDAISHREKVDSTFEEIGKAVFGDDNGTQMIKTVRSAGRPVVDDWDCFKTLVDTYKTHCEPLSTYGKKHMRAFANMCNAGVQQAQLAKVASQLCGNNFN
ncbi:vacuolar-processing enzyme gamma-isozyme [Beta vulgaris subsp. vulgaris]|uniref:vacuolar-processing enzyme gamma-isozyme n=1 Tax=Beta vulgaris subsp. vulgaris TaxID=3555 RepID=UPI002036D0A5|nr:vacuolar-processing enzyme gamma-isozyme [Beta vulgaris subsp. vulgaris]